MNKRKGIVAVVLSVAMLMSLGGCAGKFDASGYTKAVMDANYKGEIEEYMKLTESSKEEAEKILPDNLDILMDGLGEVSLTEGTPERMREIFEKLIKGTKYSVGEAVGDKEGNFTVEVTVEPVSNLKGFDKVFQTHLEEYSNQLADDMLNGAEIPSDEEIVSKTVDIMCDALNENVEAGITYSEPQNITVHVNRGEDNVYAIPEEDMNTLWDSLVLIDWDDML